MGTFTISALLSLVIAPTPGCEPAAADPTAAPMANRPRVPGVLRLHLRERREEPAGSGTIKVVERTVDWNVAETAIIVCDMWDDHHCKIAAQRVGVHGAAHEPGAHRRPRPGRDDHPRPQRDDEHLRRHALPQADGAGEARRRRRCRSSGGATATRTREPQPLPVDTHARLRRRDARPGGARGTRGSTPALDIIGFDGISDNGQEIYNFCEQEGIKNIVLMGVHTNYCILARPFGIRQMVRLGRNVVLARDLTDALYDPRQPPYVSHARGTEIVVEHIERYWCPSILGEDLTRVVPGSDGPIAATSARPGEH